MGHGLILEWCHFRTQSEYFKLYGIWEIIQCKLFVLWMGKQKAQRMVLSRIVCL